jgi:phospholipid/cholesterol/gamma-HCH transport system substrate-binding protein
MQTTTPSFSRILVMVVFALSCFGLLLFLWLSFGGPIPLKPKGYRVQVGFPEATQLGLEADVRVAGVSVGKLREKKLDPNSNRTLATLEIERKYAPLRSDTKAILRQKSLLGETYVELTPGSSKQTIPEGGRLPNGSPRRVPRLAAGPRQGHQRPRAGLQ